MVRALAAAIGTPVSFGVSGVESPPVPDEESYRQANEKALWDLVSSTRGVVLGRAGAVILASCPDALQVRVAGPPEFRAVRAAREQGIARDAAWAQLREIDRVRSDYVRRLYGHNPEAPDLYDLIIDSSVVPLDACLDAIVTVADDLWGTADGPAKGAGV